MDAADVKQELPIREDQNRLLGATASLGSPSTGLRLKRGGTAPYDCLIVHHGSRSAHAALGVSSGQIMKKHSSTCLEPAVILLNILELAPDTLSRLGVGTDATKEIEMFLVQPQLSVLDCVSVGDVVIQSMEKAEFACHDSVGLALVTSGGDSFPIWAVGGNGTNISMPRRLLSLLKGSGTTSATVRIPECVIDMGPDPQWMLDSGAGDSLTGNSSLLEGLHAAIPLDFIVANGDPMRSDSCGRASGLVNLSGVRFAPGCHKNIISVTHLVRLGCEVLLTIQGSTIRKNGTLIGKGPAPTSTERLYYLDFLNDTLLDSSCPACL